MAKVDVVSNVLAPLSVDMKKAGFVQTLPKTRRRLILATDGREKTGKTRFALTAPGPIVFINFDYGLEGPLIEEFGHKISAIRSFGSQLESGKMPTQKQAEEIWLDIANSFKVAMASGARTVIVDTFSDAWDWARLAHFGKFTQVQPHNYSEVNDMVRRLLMECHKHNSNVILIHKNKEEYKNNSPTGAMKRAGMKDMGYAVHANATHYFDLTKRFTLRMSDVRQNMDLAGMEFEGDQVTFPYIAEMVFPQSTEKDWK